MSFQELKARAKALGGDATENIDGGGFGVATYYVVTPAGRRVDFPSMPELSAFIAGMEDGPW